MVTAMSKLIAIVHALIPRIQTPAESSQAYLSHAVDIHDLERRMRELDNRADTLASGLRHGQVLL